MGWMDLRQGGIFHIFLLLFNTTVTCLVLILTLTEGQPNKALQVPDS